MVAVSLAPMPLDGIASIGHPRCRVHRPLLVPVSYYSEQWHHRLPGVCDGVRRHGKGPHGQEGPLLDRPVHGLEYRKVRPKKHVLSAEERHSTRVTLIPLDWPVHTARTR